METLEFKFENTAAKEEFASFVTESYKLESKDDGVSPNHMERVGDTFFVTRQPDVPEGGEVAPESMPEVAGTGTSDGGTGSGVVTDTTGSVEVPADTTMSGSDSGTGEATPIVPDGGPEFFPPETTPTETTPVETTPTEEVPATTVTETGAGSDVVPTTEPTVDSTPTDTSVGSDSGPVPPVVEPPSTSPIETPVDREELVSEIEALDKEVEATDKELDTLADKYRSNRG